MATSVQQLLDDIAARTAANAAWPGVNTIGNGFRHAGRALERMVEYGLDTELGGPRERLVGQLAAACEAAGAALWSAPHGGEISDLMGAAADLAGRSAPHLGRAERWAMSVEFSTAADRCADLAQRLLGRGEEIGELDQVRRHAASIERDAFANPPDPTARAALDRLAPVPNPLRAMIGSQVAAETAAALVAAIDRADDRGGLTLRELRTVTATAQISSQYIGAVAASLPGGDLGQPGRSAAAAWHLARDATADFDDLRWTRRTEQSDVVAAALLVQAALADDLGPVIAPRTSDLSTRRDLPQFLSELQMVANQNPVLAGQLTDVSRGWARNETLSSPVDLVHMENMPTPWIRAHLEGRSVRAWQGNLDIMTAALDRAGSLSTAMAVDLDQIAAGRPTQPHLTDVYARRVTGPHAGEQLLAAAQQAQQALAATRTPFRATTTHRPDRPVPDR